MTASAVKKFSAVGNDLVDLSLDILRRFFRNETSHSGLGIGGIAYLNIFQRLDQFLGKLGSDGILNYKSLVRTASLSRIVNTSADGFSDGDFHIGGVENDIGIVSAEFEEDVLQIVSAALHQFSSDRGRTGETYAVNILGLSKPCTDFSAAARDEMANAGGNTRFEKQFGQHHCRHRSVGCGFDNNGVARDNNGSDLMGVKFDREVERGYRHKNADRLSDGKDNIALSSRLGVERNGIAVKMTCRFKERFKNHAQTFKFASRVRDRFSSLGGNDLCDLVNIFANIGNESLYYLRSLVKRSRRPCRLRSFRDPCRFFKIFGSTACHVANKFAGIRVDVFKSLARARVAILAVDDHLHNRTPL